MVVPCNKWAREVLQVDLDVGPPAKRTRSSEADPEIFMTLMQPVNNNKSKRDSPCTKHNPAHSRAQEAGSSHNPASIVLPPTRVQHASNVAPLPGQHQLPLQQSSLPWWAWGPPPPPSLWNWNMWSPGAFHQMAASNQTTQSKFQHAPATPTQFLGCPLVPTPVTTTVSSASTGSGAVRHSPPATEAQTSSQLLPMLSTNSASPVLTPPQNAEEEADPLDSALSFTTTPGKT